MRRVVSLFLPSWSTDRLRRETGKPPPDVPLVLAEADRGRRVIAHVDAAARAAGIRPGMTVTRARSLVPELEVAEADPARDLQDLRRLALWAGRRYAPIVAVDPPNGLWLDITGCAHRYDGETPLLKDLMRRVRASGLACQVAVADTAGCAHAVARYVPLGRPTVIEPGKHSEALSLLPVSALRLEAGVADELHRLGFERIEQLIANPRAPLAKRFGKGLHRRLDQALGQVAEPIEPILPEARIWARRELLEPIGTAEAFGQVIGDLARDLVGKLERAGHGARSLDLYFQRVDGVTQAVRVGTARPSRDAVHLALLFVQRLERVDPGLGVEAMTLLALRTDAFGAKQRSGLLEEGGRGPDLNRLIDSLANRFGQRQLYGAEARASAMPERSVSFVPPLSPVSEAWEDDLPRPARMLDPPEPINVTAMLPDHPPAMFLWRGKRFRVTRADGPERLHGEWWRDGGHEADTQLAVRDYFQVETASGGRYWVFRFGDGEHLASGPMSWFIHGAFA